MLASLLIGNVAKILNKSILDKDLKAELEAELMMAINDVDKSQIKINLQDSKSSNWFQSMWRPGIAWICLIGFLINFLISPLCAPFGIIIPQADTGQMMPVLMGMLGLGGLRTYEKKLGVNR
tara:strand:+ start:2707 stop:3072 length:366 start_codon:yes stop_codon:yes gene_type:complete